MHLHQRNSLSVLLSIVMLLLSTPVLASVSKSYSDIETVSAEWLQSNLKTSLIIDVRSAFEYKLFHIKTAINLPSSQYSFLDKANQLQLRQAAKQLVFYCNGGECIKSFKAARRYMKRYEHEVKVYRGGLHQWASLYPELAVLQGRSPVNNTQLIHKKSFQQHLLSTEEFSKAVSQRNSLLLDIRDRTQRIILSLFVGYEFHTSLDEKAQFEKYIKQALEKKRTLLVYDAAGHQVEWLMYYLEARGVESYYFLEGGAEQYFKDITASI